MGSQHPDTSAMKEKIPIVHYIEVNSITDQKRLMEKIRDVINEFDGQIKKRKRDYRKPLKNPVAFELYYVPLN